MVENVCKPLKPRSKSNIVVQTTARDPPQSFLSACETKTRVRTATTNIGRRHAAVVVEVSRNDQHSAAAAWIPPNRLRRSTIRTGPGRGRARRGAAIVFTGFFFLRHHSPTHGHHTPPERRHAHAQPVTTTSTWCAHARTPERARFGSVRLLFNAAAVFGRKSVRR